MSDHALAVGKVFTWHELFVPNTEEAKEFYKNVLGWSSTTMDMGEMGPYSLFQSEGKGIAGIADTSTDPHMKDVPPHWAVYIAVDDVDDTVKKAEAGGGACVVPPMEIPTVGRMALLKDPHGAHFWVFKESPR